MAIDGFTERRIDTGEVTLSVHRGGGGPPLVLLHGFPQTHACWHRVAPRLAEHFDVIVPDLRGYGASDAPPDDEAHTVYSKRRMAGDITGLLDALGIDRAHVVGHDRGARVTYRLALDHPSRVDRVGIVEIVPTADFWAAWDAELAMAAYHWTFLAQPAPLPERLIGAAPDAFLERTFGSWSAPGEGLDRFAPEAMATYRAQFDEPARIAAMCADYRAGAGPDREADEADRRIGHRIAAPLLVLYGRRGFPARTGKPGAIWKGWGEDVATADCDSGHFIPEEAPEALLTAFLPFLRPD